MEKDILITESDNSWTNVENNFNEFVFHNITVHEERKSQVSSIIRSNVRRFKTCLLISSVIN